MAKLAVIEARKAEAMQSQAEQIAELVKAVQVLTEKVDQLLAREPAPGADAEPGEPKAKGKK